MTSRAIFTRASRRSAVGYAAALMLGTAGVMVAAAPAHAQQSQASLRGTIAGGATEVSAVEISTGIRRTATVSADGRYNFASLRPGVYRLDVKTATGVRQTEPFTLNVAQNAQFDFDLGKPGGAPAPKPATGSTAEPDPNATATPATGQTASDQADAGASSDEIIVTGGRLVTLDGGTVGSTISQRLIDQLPQGNRNFLAFADLAPGVRFVQEGASGQSRIQGGAQASNSVNVFIDGASQKDYVLKNGITGQDSTPGNPFPQLAIGEYKVLSSNYKAEFDQVSSVAITATTKSGTNEFHGEGFFDFTNQSLRDARPTEIFGVNPQGKVKTEDKQFGGAFGGPIVKDLAHFFVSYEGKRQSNPVDILPGNGEQISAFPTQYQGLFGTTSANFKEDLYFGKLDLVPTDKDLFELTGKYRNESLNGLGNGIEAATTATDTSVKEIRSQLRWEHTADTFVNDFKIGYEDVKWSQAPFVNEPGALFQRTRRNANGDISRFDLLRTGGGTGLQQKGQKGWTVQDDFTYTGVERHSFKVGVKAKFINLRAREQNNINPSYIYNVDLVPGQFNDTVPYRLQFAAPGATGQFDVRSKNFQFGIYAQDDWDITDRLTVNLGLRWDYERTPAYLNYVTTPDVIAAVSPANYPNLVGADYDINDYISNGNNRKAFTGAFQPRLGFTYKFDEEGRFSVFGGYGRSYDRNQFDFLQQEVNQGAFPTRTFNFQTGDPLNTCTPSSTCVAWNPIYLTDAGRQQLLAGAAAQGGGREFRFIDNDLKTPYSDQFSLGFRSRFNLLQLEVGYSHVESKDGFVFLLGNRRPDGSFFGNNPPAGTAPESPFGFTPPGWGSIIYGTNGLETSADTGYFKLTKRYTQASPWSIDATYTYTQAEENRPFGDGTYSLDFPSIKDYPMLISSGVPRHRFVMAGTVDLPIGITLATKFSIESPLYQKSVFSNSTPFERTVVGRFRDSLGDQWGRRQLDLSATKYIPMKWFNDEARIRFRVDILNLMNDRNYIDYNNDPGDSVRTADSPSVYGERSTYSVGGNPPRTIKLSAGFNF